MGHHGDGGGAPGLPPTSRILLFGGLSHGGKHIANQCRLPRDEETQTILGINQQ